VEQIERPDDVWYRPPGPVGTAEQKRIRFAAIGSELVAPGSGQVLAIDVDVPGAGWP